MTTPTHLPRGEEWKPLLLAAQRGQQADFTALARPLSYWIARYAGPRRHQIHCCGSTIDDIVQDVLLRLWHSLGAWNADTPQDAERMAAIHRDCLDNPAPYSCSWPRTQSMGVSRRRVGTLGTADLDGSTPRPCAPGHDQERKATSASSSCITPYTSARCRGCATCGWRSP